MNEQQNLIPEDAPTQVWAQTFAALKQRYPDFTMQLSSGSRGCLVRAQGAYTRATMLLGGLPNARQVNMIAAMVCRSEQEARHVC